LELRFRFDTYRTGLGVLCSSYTTLLRQPAIENSKELDMEVHEFLIKFCYKLLILYKI